MDSFNLTVEKGLRIVTDVPYRNVDLSTTLARLYDHAATGNMQRGSDNGNGNESGSNTADDSTPASLTYSPFDPIAQLQLLRTGIAECRRDPGNWQFPPGAPRVPRRMKVQPETKWDECDNGSFDFSNISDAASDDDEEGGNSVPMSASHIPVYGSIDHYGPGYYAALFAEETRKIPASRIPVYAGIKRHEQGFFVAVFEDERREKGMLEGGEAVEGEYDAGDEDDYSDSMCSQ